MGDILTSLPALASSSYIPLSGASVSGLSNADARLIAGDPEKDFSAVLKKARAGAEASAGQNSTPFASKKPVIDKSSELYGQCQELESFFVKVLLSSMRNTVQKSGLVDQGFAGEMYEDMLYDEYARDFTKNADLGLADQVYLELSGQRGKLISRYA